jgi:hypothetical protein
MVRYLLIVGTVLPNSSLLVVGGVRGTAHVQKTVVGHTRLAAGGRDGTVVSISTLTKVGRVR